MGATKCVFVMCPRLGRITWVIGGLEYVYMVQKRCFVHVHAWVVGARIPFVTGVIVGQVLQDFGQMVRSSFGHFLPAGIALSI